MLVAPVPYIPHTFPEDSYLQDALNDLNALNWKFVDCLYRSRDYGLMALGRGVTKRGKEKYMRMVWEDSTPLKEGTPLFLGKGYKVRLYTVSREDGKVIKEKKETVSRRDKGILHRYGERIGEAYLHNLSALENEIGEKPDSLLEQALVAHTRMIGKPDYAYGHVYYNVFLNQAGLLENP